MGRATTRLGEWPVPDPWTWAKDLPQSNRGGRGVSYFEPLPDVFERFDQFIAHKPDGEWGRLAPFRILSFDIECSGRPGIFPQAEVDSVIQVANYLQIHGDEDDLFHNVFTLKDCAHIANADVHSFNQESDLLMSWSDFLVYADPDVITGYNIQNFDIPYLLDRSKKLNVERFPYLGRLPTSATKATKSRFSSKAKGISDNFDISMDGRIIFDMMKVIRDDYKLSSYTLNSVSLEFLGEQKEDVHYSHITQLQEGDPETRRRLAVYCLKDACLPLRLYYKLMYPFNSAEMARVTGVPLTFLLTRGQQIKVMSQLLRACRHSDCRYIVPTFKAQGSQEKYEGATVLEPKKGYYVKPIATLDFNSLYPSIMMAHNLCYSSWLSDNHAVLRYKLEPTDYIKTPTGGSELMASLLILLLRYVFESSQEEGPASYHFAESPGRPQASEG